MSGLGEGTGGEPSQEGQEGQGQKQEHVSFDDIIRKNEAFENYYKVILWFTIFIILITL